MQGGNDDRDRPGVLPAGEGLRRASHGPEVERCLEAVRRSQRLVRLAEGIALFLAVLLGGAVLLCALDNLLRLEAAARTTILAAFGILLLGTLLFQVLIRPFRFLSDEACAILYEERHRRLDNRLINTVLFDREEHRGLEAAVVQSVRAETLAAVENVPRRRISGLRRAARLWIAALAAAAALVAYGGLFPEQLRNALARWSRPAAFVAPLSRTVLTVTPGHATIGPQEKLRVVAEASGQLPESAAIHLSYGAAPAMRFDGRAFVFEIEGQTGDFRYRVEAGDARSEEFLVRVRKLPAVEGVDLAVHPPPYTELPPRVEPAGRAARAIRGSDVEFRVRASKPVVRGSLVTKDGETLDLRRLGPRDLAASWKAERDIAYDFRLEDEEGLESPPPAFAWSLAVLADASPSAEVLRPGRDLALPPAGGLPLTLRLEDDVGLAEAFVETAQPAGEAGDDSLSWKVATVWKEVRGQRAATPSGFLDPSALGIAPGGAFLYRARAVDLKGQEAVSRTYRARVLTAAEAVSRGLESLERARPGVGDVLRRERDLRGRTASAREALRGGAKGAAGSGEDPRALAREQEAIISAGREVLLAWDATLEGGIRRGLVRALGGPMPRARGALEKAQGDAAPPRLEEALREEDAAIALLEESLRRIDEALAQLARGEKPGEDGGASRLRGDSAKLREFLDRVEKFAAEERMAIDATKALSGKNPEDFTGAEKEALEELIATQEKWGKYFADAKDDIAKIPPQDLSGGTLAEEVVEIIEEVDLARDYLKTKNVELAVPEEQMGVALAEKLETNIEKWLARARDNLKWNMEEPSAEFDVPLADLPSELEDIVGDLIDQEELMTEETEDVTSSWLDSMDDGIGWDAMDGPISNMSAKGVTGNLQPNDMEIGGRSGEGRSGRSSGQFVEETASGKGGRPTPARSTPDAFEPNEVKDTSREAGSLATGGGKLSGAGAEGLRGAPSPELQRRMGALAQEQARVRQEAERLEHSLQRRRYFSQDLARALDLMAKMEEDLRAGRPYRYTQRHREIVSDLRRLDEVVASQLEHQLEAPPPIPKDLREELLNSAGEEMPGEYRDAIRDYYRALSEPARQKEAGR